MLLLSLLSLCFRTVSWSAPKISAPTNRAATCSRTSSWTRKNVADDVKVSAQRNQSNTHWLRYDMRCGDEKCCGCSLFRRDRIYLNIYLMLDPRNPHENVMQFVKYYSGLARLFVTFYWYNEC